ncbi:vomeronasal type-2 receptor 26-like [Anomaloglossus baeobatrachus]|uniref:vomeronasal type-2 receptor 26-like n=1 Tax=Anomaloglossus baeobatrachus TaxID=238106 RepID=UPI003F507248
MVPNYSCTKKKVVGFIGDHYSLTTLPVARLLGIYPYSQDKIICMGVTKPTDKLNTFSDSKLEISYGATDTFLSDRSLFPSFFRTVPNDYTTYSIICHFLHYFGWTWVGIISSDDDTGDTETSLLRNLLTSHEICVDFVIKSELGRYGKKSIPDNEILMEKNIKIIKKSSAQIIITCGTISSATMIFFSKIMNVTHDRIFILNPTFYSQIVNMKNYPQVFNLSFLFDLNPVKIPNLESYLNHFQILKNPKDMILEDFLIGLFRCLTGKKEKDERFSRLFNIRLHKCNITHLFDKYLHNCLSLAHGNSFQMYLAVRSLATALHNMDNTRGHQSTDPQIHQQTKKVHRFLKTMTCPTKSGTETKCFNDKGEKESSYVIYNDILIMKANATLSVVGSYSLSDINGLEFSISTKDIRWKNNAKNAPRSQCSTSCEPGQRKVATSSIHFCCYDCAPCSAGETSNVTDSENCMKCPEDAWSSENRTFCISKKIEYLSYSEDIISVAFSCLSFFFCILTTLIFAIFVSHRDTPIVRANNKNLSFVLLVSIMLSFLCVFLFLGRSVDITCMLRQICTGLLLSISISSLLAKTITVYIAFKATKPGSVWRTWTGVKLPNCVLLICSSVQVAICMSWVTLCSPFQELDTQSYTEKIIVQCNEGSDLWFYSVLGYMGILAAVSFITAFLARTLPDSFNEAKYITFSMLVFCSVWIAMIPAYLSTKGKYMVAVEIFAILTSNAGLLGCIFFPKCYVILLKPELNTRSHVLGK